MLIITFPLLQTKHTYTGCYLTEFVLFHCGVHCKQHETMLALQFNSPAVKSELLKHRGLLFVFGFGFFFVC